MSGGRLELGQALPELKGGVIGGPYQQEATVSLSDFRGQWLVLYFYPKDNTSGCTKQACALRDAWQELQEISTVIGVSGDSIKSHQKFIQDHRLPYVLWSDADHALALACGVWVEKSMYGRTYMGMERTTYLVDPSGVVRAVFPKVKPDQHLDKVLGALRALQA